MIEPPLSVTGWINRQNGPNNARVVASVAIVQKADK